MKETCWGFSFILAPIHPDLHSIPVHIQIAKTGSAGLNIIETLEIIRLKLMWKYKINVRTYAYDGDRKYL